MATVTLTITDVNRVFDAIASEKPINGTIDPNTGLVYTKANWGKKWLDDLITKKVARYETRQAQLAVVVPEDPSLVVVS